MSSSWTWDADRRDYYYVTQDSSGRYTYHYKKDAALGASKPRSTHVTGAVDPRPRNDSVYTKTSDPAPRDPDLIKGTPGYTEKLDPTYRMRTGPEAHQFFKIGKVFSMLHVQAASENTLAPISDNITVIKYGERAFSQIRRFVIVEVRRGFVYACPVSTYSKRGTLKQGCIPSQHSIIYLAGQTPAMFSGEQLVKQPICVNPNREDPALQMHPASRLHYAKAYLIEMNVKVKDIGDVDPGNLSLLLQYYREENLLDSSTQGTTSYMLSPSAQPPSASSYEASTQQTQYYPVQTHPTQGYQQHHPNPNYSYPPYQNSNYPAGYQH